ncbi:helix-turn-helix domain-containing protein [Salinicoccus sesuvii]|uniref:Helix-turn-helix domain-containing protein n=1 Tax=Salinicoccus sesuvii TaxID=868281 RepID=A0ABV7N819_9STAP
MVKYSDRFKLMIVKEYLAGPLGYILLAEKYGIPSKAPIEKWTKAYQAFGEDGLRRKRTNQVYPVQFKLNVIHFIKRTGASYQDTAITFNMNTPSLIANWYKTFQREGLAGLKSKPKGRAPMSGKRKEKQSKEGNILSREAHLERENERLRLENAYLKKLKAFRQNPDAYLEKHRQRWHSNSKRKGSD